MPSWFKRFQQTEVQTCDWFVGMNHVDLFIYLGILSRWTRYIWPLRKSRDWCHCWYETTRKGGYYRVCSCEFADLLLVKCYCMESRVTLRLVIVLLCAKILLDYLGTYSLECYFKCWPVVVAQTCYLRTLYKFAIRLDNIDGCLYNLLYPIACIEDAGISSNSQDLGHWTFATKSKKVNMWRWKYHDWCMRREKLQTI